MTDRIDDYLDRLLQELAGRPADVRRVLVEVESHLLDAVDEGVASGLDEAAAVDAALARFGSPTTVARRYRRTSLPLPVRRELGYALALMAAVGLLAIGASGIASMGMRAAFGSQFVAGDTPGVTYTADRCADFERFHPESPDCAAAAGAHHADEVETYRVAAGVLGALVLGGRWWFRRRREPIIGVLPDGMVATAGTAVFGMAGMILAAQGVTGLLAEGRDHGAGQWLSASIVSLVVACGFAVTLLRAIAARSRVTSS